MPPSFESETIEEEPSVRNKLLKVKSEIQKATQEALKQASISSPTSATLFDKNDPNASFRLGMELFGQETTVIEGIVQEKLRSIENSLKDTLDIAEETVGTDEISARETSSQLEQDSKKLRTKIAFLQECSKARALLDEAVTLSSAGLAPNEQVDLVKAAENLIQAKQALDAAESIVRSTTATPNTASDPSPEYIAAYKILNPILHSVRSHKLRLIECAQCLWESSVTIAEDYLSVRATDGLTVAYAALEIFGDQNTAVEDLLRSFTRSLYQKVLDPIVAASPTGSGTNHAKGYTFQESEHRPGSGLSNSVVVVTSSKKGVVRRLSWSRTSDTQSKTATITEDVATDDPAANWEPAFAFVSRILLFVADRVLLGRKDLCKFVGKRLLGKPDAIPGALNLENLGIQSRRIGDDNGLLLEPLLDALDATCIPEFVQPQELGSLSSTATTLEKFIVPFVENMESKGLIENGKKCRLQVFIQSIEQKYVENRRSFLLNEARTLLIENDYHNTVEVGVDINNKGDEKLGLSDGLSVFKLHKSSVSDTAFKVLQLCRNIMDESIAVPVPSTVTALSVLPATLFRTARECLDMFRAIIPVTYGREIETLPRTAAVLHNDCAFFAFHCLTLGLLYQERFPAPKADDTRTKLLKHTCTFIDMVPLFRELAEDSLGDMLDLQAKQVATIVGERIPLLDQALRSSEVLAEWSDAETGMDAGLYHLRHLTQAWKPILSTEVLNRSICYLADVLFSLYLDQLAKAKDVSSEACQFLYGLFQKANTAISVLVEDDKSGSRVWERFLAIGHFMDMSLSEIQAALTDGLFRSVTGPELSKLIVACFEDSPKRKEILRVLSAN